MKDGSPARVVSALVLDSRSACRAAPWARGGLGDSTDTGHRQLPGEGLFLTGQRRFCQLLVCRRKSLSGNYARQDSNLRPSV